MPQDNAGNNLLNASNIGILGSNDRIYQDHVGGSDSNDYYRFALPQTQNFRASLAGLSADADIEVLDLMGQRVRGQEGVSRNGGTDSELINLNGLGPGIYHIRVYQYQGDTDYTLSVRAENPSTPIPIFPPPLIPPDNAGNNLLLARTIGILGSTNQAYRDWVGWADGNDYYRFITTSTTNFRLSLVGLSGDADVELSNQFGSVIRSSARGGNNSESISVDGLDAGIYHIRVYPYGGADTYYNLQLRAETPTPPDYAGNSREAARSIGTLGATNESFRDWVGSPDGDDYYRFSLSRPGNLRLTINGLSADADVEILDSQGRRVMGGISQNANNLPETLNLDSLGSGTYYARVYRHSGDTYYNLNLRAEDAIPQGRWIAEYYNNTSLSGNPDLTRIENNINNNWEFNAPANGINSDDFAVRWTGRFNFAGGNYRFNVRADDGIRIWINNSLILDQWILQPATNYQIFRDLSPGEYQIRVEYYDHDRHAVAQVGWDRIAPPDYAGNTLDNARDIGVLGNTQTYRYSDWVGSADTDDYYRFVIPNEARSNFRLALNGLGSDADVDLLGSNGQVIAFSRAPKNDQEYISQILESGTYYIRVDQYRGNTNYNLEFSRVQMEGEISRANNNPFTLNLWRYDTNGRSNLGIDANKETIVVIHGWKNNDQNPNIRELAKEASEFGAQVISLDWGSIAQAGLDWAKPVPYETASWIAPVAAWTQARLKELGILPNQISLIGHSLGAYVSSTIAGLFGRVKNLIALDPASPADNDGGYGYDIDINTPDKQSPRNFRDVADNSLAFVVAEFGLEGDNDKAATAHNSFLMKFDRDEGGKHGAVVDAFIELLDNRHITLPSLTLPNLQQNWYDDYGDKDNWLDRISKPGRHEGTISAVFTGNRTDWSNSQNPWRITGLTRVIDDSGTEQTIWT